MNESIPEPILVDDKDDLVQSKTEGLSTSQIIMLPVFISIITVSLVGNALVIISWIKFPSIRNPSNALLVSLAGVDFLSGLITTSLTFSYALAKSWIFGKAMCFVWLTTTFIFWFTSSNHLVLIAIDRYRILVEGIPYLQRRSIGQALQPAAFIWFMGICLVSPIYFDWNGTATYEYVEENSKWVCETKKSPTWVLLSILACVFGPLIALVLIYSKVYGELKKRYWKHSVGCASGANTSEARSESRTSAELSETQLCSIAEDLQQKKLAIAEEKERKAGVTLGILIIAFIICWALIIVVTVLYVLHANVPKILMLFAVMLSTINSGVNPIIYAVRSHDFRHCFKSVIKSVANCLKFW